MHVFAAVLRACCRLLTIAALSGISSTCAESEASEQSSRLMKGIMHAQETGYHLQVVLQAAD